VIEHEYAPLSLKSPPSLFPSTPSLPSNKMFPPSTAPNIASAPHSRPNSFTTLSYRKKREHGSFRSELFSGPSVPARHWFSGRNGLDHLRYGRRLPCILCDRSFSWTLPPRLRQEPTRRNLPLRAGSKSFHVPLTSPSKFSKLEWNA